MAISLREAKLCVNRLQTNFVSQPACVEKLDKYLSIYLSKMKVFMMSKDSSLNYFLSIRFKNLSEKRTSPYHSNL